MKKIKLDTGKLQLKKEKITELSNPEMGIVKGGFTVLVMNSETGFCITEECPTTTYPSGPCDTGCRDCTVCARTF